MSNEVSDDYDPYRDPESGLYDPYADPDSALYDPYLDPDAPWNEPPEPEPVDPEPIDQTEEECFIEEIDDGYCVKICMSCSLSADGTIVCEAETFDDVPCPKGSLVS